MMSVDIYFEKAFIGAVILLAVSAESCARRGPAYCQLTGKSRFGKANLKEVPSAKRILSLVLAAMMLLGCSAALATEVEVDTSAAPANLTGISAGWRCAATGGTRDVFFDTYVLQGLKAFEEEFGQTVAYRVGTEDPGRRNQNVRFWRRRDMTWFYIFGAIPPAPTACGERASRRGVRSAVLRRPGWTRSRVRATLCSDVRACRNPPKKLIKRWRRGRHHQRKAEKLRDVNTRCASRVEDAEAEHENGSICQEVGDIAVGFRCGMRRLHALAANPDVKGIATGGTASRGL